MATDATQMLWKCREGSQNLVWEHQGSLLRGGGSRWVLLDKKGFARFRKEDWAGQVEEAARAKTRKEEMGHCFRGRMRSSVSWGCGVQEGSGGNKAYGEGRGQLGRALHAR